MIFEFSVKSIFPSCMVKQTPTLFLACKSACSKNLCGFARVHLAEEDALPLAGIRQTAVGQYLMGGGEVDGCGLRGWVGEGLTVQLGHYLYAD